LRNPYVTGAYVTGLRFYGRETLLDYLANGSAHACWLIGTRRIGKTSTLRQLETLALTGHKQIPVFWDMQGAESLARLGRYLADAIAAYGPRFEPLGLAPIGLGEDPIIILRSLRRAVLSAGRELLLLCDETEALLKIARAEPEGLQRLHRELTDATGLRVVMASTRGIFQLHDICADWSTSPFLEGFDLSQTLGSLSPTAMRDLVLQAHMPADQRVTATPEVIEAILDATNGHPYLTQIMCARLYQEDGTLRMPVERDFSVEPTLRGFFNHDFNALTPSERAILLAVHAGAATDEATLATRIAEPSVELHRRIYGLETLGYLRRTHNSLAIGSRFLANYLALRPESLARMPGSRASENAVRLTLSRQQEEKHDFLLGQLNNRRARLLQLEAIRARKLLKTPNATLVEMAQVESEIRRLRRLLGDLHPV
jgi:hypothetical protein